MVWSFKGTTQQTWLSLSPDGHWSLHGESSQHCYPEGGVVEILKYVDVDGVLAEWHIHSFDASRHDYDSLGDLKTLFENNEGKAVASIEFQWGPGPKSTLVKVSIVMPPAILNDLITRFRTTNGNAATKYSIDLEFLGLRDPDVPPSELPPSISEFVKHERLGRRPYLSRKVTVTIY